MPVLTPGQLQVILPFGNDNVASPTSSPPPALSPLVAARGDLPPELRFIEDQAYNEHSMLTRGNNGIVKKKTFQDFCAYSSIVQQKLFDEYAFFSGFIAITDVQDLTEPKSFKAAGSKSEWKTAMGEEIDALIKQGTWILVPCRIGENIVGNKWI